MTDESGFDELVGVPAPDLDAPASQTVLPDGHHRHRRRLDLLSETAGRLLMGQDLDAEVLPWLLHELAVGFEVQVGLAHVAKTSGGLRLAFQHGLDERLVSSGSAARLSGTTVGEGQAVHTAQVQATTGRRHAWLRRAGVRAFVVEPLVVQGELLGMLGFGSRTRDRFDDEDLLFFRSLAHPVALARHQARTVRAYADREVLLQTRVAELTTANAELHHRAKNLLTTVQAIAHSSLRSVGSLAEFEDGFGGRLSALAKTHDLLVTRPDGATSLERLLRSELEPYDDKAGSRVRLDGPEVWIGADIAVPLGLVLHELTTNAAKYGALSLPGGSVRVSWSVAPGEGGRRLRLAWAENGGPTVSPPSRRGFGSQLLERVFGGQFGARVEREFAPDGVRVRIELMLD